MTWFSILFLVVWGIFLLKNIISWTFGDLDVDVDFDGDTDIDMSGMLSFKGILHFLLGFSTVLEAYAYSNTHSLTAPFQIPIFVYFFAIMGGIVCMMLLFYLYRLMMTLNHYSTDNINLDNMKAKIYTDEGDGQYQVLVDTPSGTFKKTAYSEDTHNIGDEVLLVWDEMKKEYSF